MLTSVNLLPIYVGFLSLFVGVGCYPDEVKERHAAAVEAYLPAPDLPDNVPYLDPEQALGPPDGRTLAVGRGSSLTLRFFRPVRDGLGPDLRVYEIGDDGAQARVGVSVDGDTFQEFAGSAEGTTSVFDLEALDLPQIFFVRIRGLDDAGEEPGFDLDALEALH